MAEGPSLVEKRQIKTNLRLPVFGNEQKKKKTKKRDKSNNSYKNKPNPAETWEYFAQLFSSICLLLSP